MGMAVQDELRKAMKASGTRYRISKQTGITASTLSRFAAGHDLRGDIIDRLAEYLEMHLTAKPKARAKKGAR